jgi:hypothetical protein
LTEVVTHSSGFVIAITECGTSGGPVYKASAGLPYGFIRLPP